MEYLIQSHEFIFPEAKWALMCHPSVNKVLDKDDDKWRSQPPQWMRGFTNNDKWQILHLIEDGHVMEAAKSCSTTMAIISKLSIEFIIHNAGIMMIAAKSGIPPHGLPEDHPRYKSSIVHVCLDECERAHLIANKVNAYEKGRCILFDVGSTHQLINGGSKPLFLFYVIADARPERAERVD